MLISHGMSDLLSCDFAETGYLNMPDQPVLHFPRIISFEQKYRHPVYDVPDRKSLQQVLPYFCQNAFSNLVDESNRICLVIC